MTANLPPPPSPSSANFIPCALMTLLCPQPSLLSMIDHRHLPPPSLLFCHLPLTFSSTPYWFAPPSHFLFPSPAVHTVRSAIPGMTQPCLNALVLHLPAATLTPIAPLALSPSSPQQAPAALHPHLPL